MGKTGKKQFLETGKIVNTHGVNGGLKVEPWSDTPEFLLQFKKVYIDEIPHQVESARVHGRVVIMQLKDILNMDDAARYKSKLIYIDRDDAALEDGSWFIQDIIGLPVSDEHGNLLGKLTEVLFLPANQVYVVKGEQEHLIPAVPEYVKKVDTEAGIIVVSLIEGM